jgi:molybdate transport repressor ModE-like protein
VELIQLRYFLAIADAGSITGAARSLGVSQPTITVAIQRLEETLKTKLLLRGRQGVTLTRTGEAFVHHSREVFAALERAEQRIAGLEQDEVGSFVVGCHDSIGAYFLPSFLKEFLCDAPGIDVALWSGTSVAVEEAVLERRVDFGLVVNPRPHPSLVIVELFDDAVDVFVEASSAPVEDSSEARMVRAVEMLRKGPLVYAARVTQCQVLIDRLGAEHMLPMRLLSCGDLELVKSMALAGVGVALLPRRVAAYGQEGKLARLHPDMPFFPDLICLVYREDIHRTRAALRIKDALVAHGRSLATTRG